MGLISLPYLNRVGVYSYWNNVWDKSLNYTKYLYLDVFLNIFFLKFFDDLTFSILFKIFNQKIGGVKRGYLDFFKKNIITDLSLYFYLGKVWIFIYQEWLVIKVNLLLSSKESKKNINKSINFFKFYKNFIKNKNWFTYSNNYAYMNYKYKI